MNYWLHRIAHLQNVSHPLLEKGYLSIGFSDFCNDEFFKQIAKNENWDYLDNSFNERWGYLSKTRYNLWRFLVEMKRGDLVIVPKWETFSVYEICDDMPIMVTDKNIDLPTTDWNGNNIQRDTESYLLKLENEIDYLDLGFLRKIKILYADIPRNGFADSALTSRMKIRNTNACISELSDSVQKAIQHFKKDQPINLKAEILSRSTEIWHNIIQTELTPDKYEKLVKWYFEKIGATESYISPKNYKDKSGDVDVVATFESIKTIINVQVKFYKGETSDWAINQIKDFANSKENMSDGYSRQYWVISSSDSFSQKSCNLAKENNILLVDGRQFIRMLLDVGLETLETFDA